jgi:hypothetical protein
MSIWVEYFIYEDSRWENSAQMRELPKWTEPENVLKRFFDNRMAATKFAGQMGDQGYHCTVKEDSGL